MKQTYYTKRCYVTDITEAVCRLDYFSLFMLLLLVEANKLLNITSTTSYLSLWAVSTCNLKSKGYTVILKTMIKIFIYPRLVKT